MNRRVIKLKEKKRNNEKNKNNARYFQKDRLVELIIGESMERNLEVKKFTKKQ